MQGDGDRNDPGRGTAVITRTKTKTKKPSLYKVLLLNDDYTPMEFVVSVLRKYFNKNPDEATRIMLHVHQHGAIPSETLAGKRHHSGRGQPGDLLRGAKIRG